MMQVLALAGASGFMAQPPVLRAVASSAVAAPCMMGWQDEPIFDKTKPDPIFEVDTPYKGRVPYGFSNQAEKINGRAAMMGFTVAYFQELFVGKGILEQYGLPYDEGAVITSGGTGLPSVLGVIVALLVTAGLSYGGEYLNNKVFNKEYNGYSLPFSPFAPDEK